MSESEEKCAATFEIGDNFGDNSATMRCQLFKGHEGPHQETWKYGFKDRGIAILTFTLSEAEAHPEPSPCDSCSQVDECEGWHACTRTDV